MKKQLPLILSMIIGFLAISSFYIPAIGDVEDVLVSWAQVLAAMALILGAINLVQVNYPKIRRREKDWQFKGLLLGSAAVMLLAGIPWHKLGADAPETQISVLDGVDAELASRGRGRIALVPNTDVMVSIDGAQPVAVTVQGAGIEVDAGQRSIQIYLGATDFTVVGYTKFLGDIEVKAGQSVSVRPTLVMKWGLGGRVFTWFYDHVFDPCNSTMFALLAFFIASAAFRAFRARNVEAALLLGAAILVMLGRVPIGSLLSESFPYIADWLVDVPNNAGRRAIMMGAALGAVATGLRVILGLERSHLGSD